MTDLSNRTVLIIDDSSKVDFGGGQQITLYVAGVLRAESVELIFADYTNSSRYALRVREEFSNARFIAMKSRMLRSPRIPKILRRMFEILTLKLYLRSNLARLVAILPDEKRDLVIYVASKKGLTVAHRLHKSYAIPYVFHAHLVESPGSMQFRAMMPYLRDASRIICTSRAVMGSYGMLPNAVMQYNPSTESKSVKAPRVGGTDKKFTVAYVGGLIPIKGVDYFIAAAKEVGDLDIEFRVYGDGPLRKDLESQSDGKVRFMGFCNDVRGELTAHIDLLVLPTVIAEALPTVIIEAKSAGIPVITTNLGGQAEIVRDGIDGILISPHDGKQIAEAVRRLWQDIELYNQMAAASKQSASMFSTERFDRTLIESLFPID